MLRPSITTLALMLALSAMVSVSNNAFAQAQQAQAPKVLLVSDIDDTIKVSHVLNKVGQFARAVDATTPFKGMGQLYQLIFNQNPATTKIAYLSNAPKDFSALPNAPKELGVIPASNLTHQFFLDFNRFPKGELILREDLQDQDHKAKALRRLIETERPDILILIGDNGEKDVDFYKQAIDEHAYMKNMLVFTFIHQLYKSEPSFYLPAFLDETGRILFANQIGFVTPIEIALKLKEQNIIGQDKLDWMLKNVAPAIVAEASLKWDGLKPISFPFFKKCPDFKWNFQRTMQSYEQSLQLQKLIHRIESECN